MWSSDICAGKLGLPPSRMILASTASQTSITGTPFFISETPCCSASEEIRPAFLHFSMSSTIAAEKLLIIYKIVGRGRQSWLQQMLPGTIFQGLVQAAALASLQWLRIQPA